MSVYHVDCSRLSSSCKIKMSSLGTLKYKWIIFLMAFSQRFFVSNIFTIPLKGRRMLQFSLFLIKASHLNLRNKHLSTIESLLEKTRAHRIKYVLATVTRIHASIISPKTCYIINARGDKYARTLKGQPRENPHVNMCGSLYLRSHPHPSIKKRSTCLCPLLSLP